MRGRRVAWYLIAPLAVVATAVIGFLVSPLFLRPTLVEESPLLPSAPTAVAAAAPTTPTLPPTSPPAPATLAPARPPESTSTPAPSPAAGPRILARGMFDVKDAIHRGSGTAILAQTSEGRTIVRFEDFSVTNGPDLFVYLSAHPRPANSAELHADGLDVNLGRLKAPQGAFSYEVPDEVDLRQVRSVAVYCRAFRTMFSSAELQPL